MKKGLAKTIMEGLADKLGSNRWYSTQTTAYSLLAIAKFVTITGTGEKVKFDYNLDKKGVKTIETTQAISQIDMQMKGESNGPCSIAKGR